MSKQKIFIETTLFNRYYDTDRDGHRETVMLFEAIGKGVHEGYTSTDVINELEDAEEDKRIKMLTLIEKYGIYVLKANYEVDNLANVYIEHKVIPLKYFLDAAHIANATVNNLDSIMSFNFKHINKKKTKIMTKEINLSMGYKEIKICTPKDVFYEEDKR